jgi:hypothetical protein
MPSKRKTGTAMIRIRGKLREDKCDECGAPEPTMFILRDEIWQAVANPNDYLCFDCIQRRLARPVIMQDLEPDCSITRGMELGVQFSPNSGAIMTREEFGWLALFCLIVLPLAGYFCIRLWRYAWLAAGRAFNRLHRDNDYPDYPYLNGGPCRNGFHERQDPSTATAEDGDERP